MVWGGGGGGGGGGGVGSLLGEDESFMPFLADKCKSGRIMLGGRSTEW